MRAVAGAEPSHRGSDHEVRTGADEPAGQVREEGGRKGPCRAQASVVAEASQALRTLDAQSCRRAGQQK